MTRLLGYLALVLLSLQTCLAASPTIPARTNNNVIVAAYNIQFLGQRDHDKPVEERLARLRRGPLTISRSAS